MVTRIALNGNEGNWLIGIGVESEFCAIDSMDWSDLDAFITENSGQTIFVTLSYDLGMHIETIKRQHTNFLPLAQLWTAKAVYETKNGELLLKEGSSEDQYRLAAEACLTNSASETPDWKWQAAIEKTDYLKKIETLKAEIQYGNIYEINFCQEFFSEGIELSHIDKTYHRLNSAAPSPFSLFLEQEQWMLACASPERYLKKVGAKIISQPIKGTARRSTDLLEDEKAKNDLQNDPKERAENVMIVDLVRNDLSRIAAKGSVHVDELCGLYSFPRVHQLISTISCELKPNTSFSEIIRATFPMGSMTGAPKISAMQLSESHETFAREFYSGTVGYIAPNGDFDLNVIIRSFTYNREKKRVSCAVGGAITIHSDPEKEYQECQTKVGHLLQLFGACPW
jgi:para-aminobenzoate synthetase component 1